MSNEFFKQNILPYIIVLLLGALGLLKLAWFVLLYVVPVVIILLMIVLTIHGRIQDKRVSLSLKQ